MTTILLLVLFGAVMTVLFPRIEAATDSARAALGHEALRLYNTGMTFSQIGAALRVSPQRASQLVKEQNDVIDAGAK